MDRMKRERERLLQRTARVYGLSFSAVAAACILLAGEIPVPAAAGSLALLAVLAVAQWRIGTDASVRWMVVVLVAGLAAMVVAQLGGRSASSLTALTHISVGGIGSLALLGTVRSGRLRIVAAAFVLTSAVAVVASWATAAFPYVVLVHVFGWMLAGILGYWLSVAVHRVGRRITDIGRAHRAERMASELEAQRRQGARLLHDTVLATLTLLAHSGVGVTPQAMRQQAADDARLLRQLRLGANPTPQASGGYTLEPVEQSVLGNTLESVKQRFGRMGLEVSWHGTGQVLLPSDILDAFLLSLAECLENVRRHAGVTEAHVTITDDDTTVRAMVTDAGVGFDLAHVDQAKLGFKESVVARLTDVGGNARLFSSPGSGTTVVLEVPK
ncbi:sensor histidine kinase [Clavibacter sepedonicus]|nr:MULTISPECIES: ATP-binding protein [Clavibacter]MBD5382949.1 ATP-binding protein [Clavibacter sp.]OQJ47781.1 ATP-binding protein [Clavibacter sepedonicus]OQJ53289.1 ATP-binding protein [Clavibacter sepedonicus]UUK64507.1 ATP-binding protein [Clavibacter sepedonicus]